MRARLDAPRRAQPAAPRWSPTPRRRSRSPRRWAASRCVLKTTRGGYDGKGVWVVALRGRLRRRVRGRRLDRRADPRRGEGRLPARAVRAGGPVALRPGRGLPRRGVRAARRHLLGGHRPRARPRRGRSPSRRSGSRCGSPPSSTSPASSRSSCSRPRDGRVLVNELAMRPHNTGHWSMDGAVTGQFENHLRAVLDLPLGSPAARAPVDGDGQHPRRRPRRASRRTCTAATRTRSRATRGLKVHLYGKDVKPGRKVGHVTAYGDDLDDVRERARHAAAWFRGDLGDGERMSTQSRAQVGIVMGSDSDWPTMKAAARGARGVRRRPSRPTSSRRTGCPRRCWPTARRPPAAGCG